MLKYGYEKVNIFSVGLYEVPSPVPSLPYDLSFSRHEAYPRLPHFGGGWCLLRAPN